jgi:hypothetical protein
MVLYSTPQCILKHETQLFKRVLLGKVARTLVLVSLYGRLPAPGRLFARPGVPLSPGRTLLDD